ncbi:uncharacterized protein LOC122680109 [Cervus elaphus]|uniref:uncharacterized protein LOC122680109 n=1 Tax=Cervus elaphus TaxID=9860 RepID=UPI001CC299EA|nr:uncharacterized protein LOC122680109 [Cervus elaphus]XP_043737016.1 uncharacterized protein LOC122680109 [Cervus elaphus]
MDTVPYMRPTPLHTPNTGPVRMQKRAATNKPTQQKKPLECNLPCCHLHLGLPRPPELGYGWKVLVALSVTGAERTSPGVASGLSPVTRPHKQSSLPPGLGGKPAPGLLGVQGTTRTGRRLLNEYSMSPYGAHPCILTWKKSTGTKEKSDGGSYCISAFSFERCPTPSSLTEKTRPEFNSTSMSRMSMGYKTQVKKRHPTRQTSAYWRR